MTGAFAFHETHLRKSLIRTSGEMDMSSARVIAFTTLEIVHFWEHWEVRPKTNRKCEVRLEGLVCQPI
jgi:hypothetical protein